METRPRVDFILLEDQQAAGEELLESVSGVPELHCKQWLKSIKEFHAQSETRADLFIVDIDFPDGSGLNLIRPLTAKNPSAKIIVYTAYEEENLLLKAIEQGADGFLVKGRDSSRLPEELRSLVSGGFPLTAALARKILLDYSQKAEPQEKVEEAILTVRETEILQFIALGLPVKEVAEELELSYHTVRRHVESIYRKLQAKNRVQAIRIARRQGILEDNED